MTVDWDRSRRTQRGAAALEFALIAPVLVYLVFGMVSWGFMLSFRQAMSQGAAEGGRAAAVASAKLTPTVKTTRAREAVNAALDSYGVSCTSSGTLTKDGANAGTCTISSPQSCSGSTAGAQCVKVTLDYSYRAHSMTPALPLIDSVLPQTLSYTTEAQVS